MNTSSLCWNIWRPAKLTEIMCDTTNIITKLYIVTFLHNLLVSPCCRVQITEVHFDIQTSSWAQLLVHCFNPFRAYNFTGTEKSSDYIISSTLYPLTALHGLLDTGNTGSSALLPVGSGDKAVAHFLLVTSGELWNTLCLRKLTLAEGNQLF